ncbi:uncharacterized protein BO80DRAFT_444659 [Aspergillus ibericus CBS 121593]|uniref:Uncharacterized protein n=1 Tax=Aspergillus ibericus CBS 121593 TaxID=1448316 RepID=A0A395H058_9EURO|nr:hypothetical protein BO80DRAFT_444659 [Aspergillus ibericus CBS 121593]RAL01211.1 hypothetical protein BO80DRAFT_444659 [Aspergillus ibericus CBS 121593]
MADQQQKRERDTLSSIYSYYKTNEQNLEHVPSFISDGSGDIPIALAVPSADQTEEYKQTLRELLQIKEVIDGISARETE